MAKKRSKNKRQSKHRPKESSPNQSSGFRSQPELRKRKERASASEPGDTVSNGVVLPADASAMKVSSRKGDSSVGGLLTRREMVQAVLTAAFAEGIHVLYESVKGLVPSQLSMLNDSTERGELVADLFFPSSSAFHIVPSRHQPRLPPLPEGQLTYPNQLQAIEGIRGIFGNPKTIVDSLYPVDSASSMVFVGSPTSNLAARSYFGDPWSNAKRFSFRGQDFVNRWRYTIVHREDTSTRLQDGIEIEVPNYSIVDDNGIEVATPMVVGSSRRLVSDLLLFTRMEVGAGGPEVVFFSGLHGPSVRAIDLILHSIDVAELRRLRQSVEDVRNYQAIFRVTGLKECGDTTMPESVSLLDLTIGQPRRVERKVL